MTGRRRQGPRPEPRRYDPFFDDDGLRRIYRALQSGKWDEFLSLLDAGRTSWLARSLLTAEDAAVETVVFRRLVEARPTAQTLTLLGAAQARDAWALVAGYVSLEVVPPELRNELEAQMVEAEVVLDEALSVRPAMIEPWIHLLSTGRGLRLDLRELRSRFERVHTREPFRPDAVLEYLLGLSYRGGGDDAAMFDFANWVNLEAPHDSPAQIVLPSAHIEYGLGSSPRSLTDHLSLPDTSGDVAKALARYLRAIPVDAPPWHLPCLNAFALAITVESEETASLAKECFRRIDNRLSSYPWSLYEEDIAAVFVEVQRAQLRSAARFGV